MTFLKLTESVYVNLVAWMRIGDVVFTGVYRYREDKLQWRWGKLRIQWRPVSAWKPTAWRRQMWVLVYHILLVSFAKSSSIRLSVLKMFCLLTDDRCDRENCERSNPSVYHFSQNSVHSSKVMTSGPAFFVGDWALNWCYMETSQSRWTFQDVRDEPDDPMEIRLFL